MDGARNASELLVIHTENRKSSSVAGLPPRRKKARRGVMEGFRRTKAYVVPYKCEIGERGVFRPYSVRSHRIHRRGYRPYTEFAIRPKHPARGHHHIDYAKRLQFDEIDACRLHAVNVSGSDSRFDSILTAEISISTQRVSLP